MDFLHAQREEGSTESEGSFTVAREKAVVKMAEFQLPFAEAWAIKVVQAVVAQGGAESINVRLMLHETHFEAPASLWDLAEVESAFYEPNAGGKRPLKHLMVGLWSLGIQDRRAFRLSVPGHQYCLVWDGNKMLEVPTSSEPTGFRLTVSHGRADVGKAELFSNIVHYRKRNAEILSVLSEYAFPCPVPLRVDGRRFDALQFAPSAGWLQNSVLLGLGLVQGSLPELPIPPGTFEDIVRYTNVCEDEPGWDSVSAELMRALEPVPAAAMAVLITVCPEGGKWLDREWSKILWVQDGALIDAEPLLGGVSEVVLGCFLNADDLPTDLTTVTLLKTPEKKRRVKLARGLTRRMLSEHHMDYTKLKVSQGVTKGPVLLLLAGIGSVWAAPLVGTGLLVGGLVGLTSLGKVNQARQVAKAVADFQRELTQFIEEND